VIWEEITQNRIQYFTSKLMGMKYKSTLKLIALQMFKCKVKVKLSLFFN